MSGRNRPSRAVALPLQTRTQTRVSYREVSESETDYEDARSGPEKRPFRKRKRVSYQDASSESNGEEEIDSHQTGTSADQHSNGRAPAKRLIRKSQPASTKKKKPRSLDASQNQNRHQKTNTKHVQEHHFEIAELGGKVPPWQTLPYEILFQVFQYASYPLITETFEPTSSVYWLVQSALLCKGFGEPALSALYYAPPLTPPSRVHDLITTLANQSEAASFNYRAKIKYLDLEALEVLCYKSLGQDPVRLADLVSKTTQLRGIDLRLKLDNPIYGNGERHFAQAQSKRMTDQTSLYAELVDHNIRLLEWTWNALLAAHLQVADELKAIHRKKAFQSLRSLTFVNSTDIKQSAESTSVLPNMKILTLRNCHVGKLGDLKSVPSDLEFLAVYNCQSFASSILTPLLASHGANLRNLLLNHNNSLNLAFLPNLASSCPHLEKLHMDLRFYNTLVSSRDLEPHFDTLLTHKMVPTWPRSLQRLQLFHLRKWDMAAADTFFSSLVDSAAELPNLRYIDIKASINESNWRERISFRNKWQIRMERVFKRVIIPPDPRLRSISVFMKHKHEFANNPSPGTYPATGSIRNEVKKRFTHVEIQSEVSTNISSDSDAPLASRLRSKRGASHPDSPNPLQQTPRPSRRSKPKRKRNPDEDSSTEEDSALEDLNNDKNSQLIPDDDDDKDLFIQGMCDVVRVAIDNLRPTEEHLNESNFLDDEISGDEDYQD